MGIGAARKTERLFLALLPDPDALRQLVALGATLRGELGFTGTLSTPERLHVTLHFLGDRAGLPEPLVQTVGQVAAHASQAQCPFRVSLDRARSFHRPHGRRPFVLLAAPGADALRAFQQALGAGLAQAGLPHTPIEAYTPHLTLLYDPMEIAERPIALPIAWSAQDCVLVRSRIGRGSHEVLARWPLQPLP